MSLTIEEYKEEILAGNRMATLEEHMKALEDLPDLPDWAELYSPIIIGVGQFRIDIPFDVGMYKKLRNLLGKRWFLCKSREACDTHKAFEFKHAILPVGLEIVLILGRPGSTCVRVKVAEETITKAVYEVRCE